MMTFYRKYRPRLIRELDLEKVAREGLGKLLEGQSLAHAYLFTGPRGSGKTSAARILAKLINCEKNEMAVAGSGKLIEPCLECPSCKSIEAGTNLDVIEIDAASNRGIDAIRELRDKIGLAPVSGVKKVYIIDEVHMLTAEAFNALLKTLEEPPSHAAFILCTTEAHKVPETISSRCRLVGFTKATPGEVKQSLKKAVAGEKLEIEEAALDRLASAVDGSFREGHKLLEQLSSTGGKITEAEIEKLLGLAYVHQPKDLASAIATGDTQAALSLITELDSRGINWPNFAVEMLRFYQKELEANFGVGTKQTKLTIEQLRLAAQTVNTAATEMRTSPVPSLPLELAVIGLGKPQAQPEATPPPDSPKRNFKPAAAPESAAPTTPAPEPTRDLAEAEPRRSFSVDLLTIQDKWRDVIHACEPKNHSVAGLLRSSKPKAIEGQDLVLEVFYKFHKEQLELDSKMKILEESVEQVVGPLRIRCVLGERTTQTLIAHAADDNIATPEMDAKELKAVEEVFGLVH